MKQRLFATWLLTCLAISATGAASAQTGPAAPVVAVMMKTFDRPDSRLKVEPVVMDGDVAIAGWIQDNRGGRAFLRRKADRWVIALCAGESLRHEAALVQIGVDPPRARRLASALAGAERKLPKASVALFDSFEGTVAMDEQGHHPPTHGAQNGGAHASKLAPNHAPNHAPKLAQNEPAQGHSAGRHRHGGHNRFDNAETWSKSFDDPKRDEWQKPHEIIAALALKPADIVADLGAGTGYLASKLAIHVPRGKVYAADLSKDMVAFLDKRAKGDAIANMQAIQASEASPNLPEQVDVAVLLDVYHHIDNRIAYFQRLQSSLKPGARVAVIDFRPDAPEGAPKHMRIPVSKVDAEMHAAGFVRAASHDFLPRQYFLVYRAAK